MAIKEQDEENVVEENIRAPLMRGGGEGSGHGSSKEDPWMVYLSTFVAVCGSYEFGCCVSASVHVYLTFHVLVHQESCDLWISKVLFLDSLVWLPGGLFIAYSVCDHRRSQFISIRGREVIRALIFRYLSSQVEMYICFYFCCSV